MMAMQMITISCFRLQMYGNIMELSFPVFCISRETVNFPFQSCFIQINFLQLCLIALQFFIHCFRVNLNANPFFNGLGIYGRRTFCGYGSQSPFWL